MNHKSVNRRRVLRGMMRGTAFGLGLPLLDLFLNDNGNALASGDDMPVCFGTWNWGLGFTYGTWVPNKTGSDYELPGQLKSLSPIKDKINIYSGMQVFLEGPNQVHFSGPQCIMTGRATDMSAGYGHSIDNVIAEKLRVRTRFPSVSVSCSGKPTYSWSAKKDTGITPAEISPLALYNRIFGAGFQDPNADGFTPDPKVMLRHSLLSYVADERQALVKEVGADDRVRLDGFFSSMRDLEQRLALELEKPKPLAACSPMTDKPERNSSSVILPDVLATHDLMADIICHALSCGQTRIFNMAIDRDVVLPGDPTNNHVYSHEEPTDPKLGYQPMCYWFADKYMQSFQYLVSQLDKVKEGDSTLLDRTLIMAYTDHGDARLHSVVEMPLLTAGGAGGGMKNGMHIRADGDACTRVGFTCQQALGLSVSSWGADANRVTRPFTEVLS